MDNDKLFEEKYRFKNRPTTRLYLFFKSLIYNQFEQNEVYILTFCHFSGVYTKSKTCINIRIKQILTSQFLMFIQNGRRKEG